MKLRATSLKRFILKQGPVFDKSLFSSSPPSGKICLASVTVRFFAPELTESDKTLRPGSVFSALSIGAIYSSLTFFVFEI